MKKIIKVPAKVNLNLLITGYDGEYHELSSVFCSINLYDKVTVKARKDKQINIIEKGIKTGVPTNENNAYSATKLFMETFNTSGADIVIDKHIPIGNGLGGSSADIVGVINGMRRVYDVAKDVYPVLLTLGSDTAFMKDGGYALISGRGEKIVEVSGEPLYMNILFSDNFVTAKECYKKYREGKYSKPINTSIAEDMIKNPEKNKEWFKNDLYKVTKKLCPEIEEKKQALIDSGAIAVEMTGSGPAIVGYYKTKAQRNLGAKKLKQYKKYLIKAKTL